MIKLIHKYCATPPTVRQICNDEYLFSGELRSEKSILFSFSTEETIKYDEVKGKEKERKKKKKKKGSAAPIKRHQWGVRLGCWMMMSSSSWRAH